MRYLYALFQWLSNWNVFRRRHLLAAGNPAVWSLSSLPYLSVAFGKHQPFIIIIIYIFDNKEEQQGNKKHRQMHTQFCQYILNTYIWFYYFGSMCWLFLINDKVTELNSCSQKIRNVLKRKQNFHSRFLRQKMSTKIKKICRHFHFFDKIKNIYIYFRIFF